MSKRAWGPASFPNWNDRLRSVKVAPYTPEQTVNKQVVKSRRHHKRVETPDGVWVLWKCGRAEDTSRVKDLGVGGVFVETKKACPVGGTVDLHFLVPDGEVRASATVRFVLSGVGMGLQFKAVRGEDQTRFASMIKRIIEKI